MTGIQWVCAVPAAQAREDDDDRWYGNPAIRKFSRLYWLRSNRKAALAEAVEYLAGNHIKYAVLRDRGNHGQYVIATDSDVCDHKFPEGYWDVDSDYWKKFPAHAEEAGPPVMVHQHDDLSWCITFGDEHGVTLRDVAVALITLPTEALDQRLYHLSTVYYSAATDCEGQLFMDDKHTEGVTQIQTEAQLCPEHAAEHAAESVVNEAEEILGNHGHKHP